MSVRLSPKHGVNASCGLCIYCLKAMDVVLFGHIRGGDGDMEAPRQMIHSMEPCDKCKGYMEEGIIVITMRDGEGEKMEEERLDWKRAHEHKRDFHDRHGRGERKPFPGFHVPNPHRTGGWYVVRDVMLERAAEHGIVPVGMLAQVIRQRWVFMEDGVVKIMGFPKPGEPIEGDNEE
jgi:hypothetical protein